MFQFEYQIKASLIYCLHRCIVDETSKQSEPGPMNQHEHLAGSAFPMNVSVSVADAGETAVVVSNINGNQQTNQIMLSSVYTSMDMEIGMII